MKRNRTAFALFALFLVSAVAVLAQDGSAVLTVEGKVSAVLKVRTSAAIVGAEVSWRDLYVEIETRRVVSIDGSQSWATVIRLTCSGELAQECQALRPGDRVRAVAEFPLEPVRFTTPSVPPHITELELLDAE